ncbi:peptidylprolyl isomerase [Gammaproteobacteria bacterium]|nr:peptidylprolyl isomerase [Gammaproteobacteria bacterium]
MKKYIKQTHNLCFIILFNFFLSFASYADQTLDRIVVVINNGVIVESELNEAINKVKKQLAASNTPIPETKTIRKQILNQLINKKLQLQLAEMSGVKVTDKQINGAVLSIAKKNRLTIDELYAELAKQGIKKEDYRQDIHDEYLIHQVQEQAVGPTVKIDPQEVTDFMRSATWQAHNNKEYHLEDILISLPETPSTLDIINAKNNANKLLEKIKNGANFNEIAMSESNGSKALQGGDLGWRKLPEIPSAFASLILPAHKNEIVGPIQTANGFHLIHIADIRKNENELKGEAERKQIQQYIFERKFEESLQDWLSKIRSEAFISTNLKS